MQLSLQSQTRGDVVIIRCKGRIVSGDEARHLQQEIERLTPLTKNVVLQLAEVNYLDSGGLGSLVRIYGVLRAARGDLKLAELSPFVVQVLEATNLLKVLKPFATEAQAVAAFAAKPGSPEEAAAPASAARVVCIDSSLDVLAYLKVLLQRSGYEVFTTRHLADAVALAIGTKPRVVVCGPAMSTDAVAEKLRHSAPNARLLHLPADFSTSEADQGGRDLVDRVRALLA
jgi:anti-anti-sigma factor